MLATAATRILEGGALCAEGLEEGKEKRGATYKRPKKGVGSKKREKSMANL